MCDTTTSHGPSREPSGSSTAALPNPPRGDIGRQGTNAFDHLLQKQRGALCLCGAAARAKLTVQLRDINGTGSFFKGGRSLARSINVCEPCGVERWERYREAALVDVVGRRQPSVLDRLLVDQSGMTCRCEAKVKARLTIQLRDIDSTGSFVKGGRSLARSINVCEQCGAEQWECYYEAMLAIEDSSSGASTQ